MAAESERSHIQQERARLGVVSFLNSRPLIAGMDSRPEVSMRFAVPSALAAMVRRSEVDVALVPVVDLARSGGRLEMITDCCIASDGPTLTVRVFSRAAPEAMTELHVDGDSHTSVVLTRLIWREVYGRRLAIRRLKRPGCLDDCESVMLIGDKVVTQAPSGFPYQIDLGDAWKSWTGLPFVFAVWARRAGEDLGFLAPVLEQARDRGVADAARIAATQGPALGWPEDLARAYLVDHLCFRMDARMREGMTRFLGLAERYDYLRCRQTVEA